MAKTKDKEKMQATEGEHGPGQRTGLVLWTPLAVDGGNRGEAEDVWADIWHNL